MNGRESSVGAAVSTGAFLILLLMIWYLRRQDPLDDVGNPRGRAGAGVRFFKRDISSGGIKVQSPWSERFKTRARHSSRTLLTWVGARPHFWPTIFIVEQRQ